MWRSVSSDCVNHMSVFRVSRIIRLPMSPNQKRWISRRTGWIGMRPRPDESLECRPLPDCGGDGALVEIVEFATDGDAVGEPRDPNAEAGELIHDVVRRGLALHGGVERQDHFAD